MVTKAQLQQIARAAARRHGVPEAGFLALITQESGWNPSIRSPAGAVGIAQFMPATARGLGINPLDPSQALNASAKHLATLYKNLGSWKLALAGYNAGGGAVQRYGGVPPYAETQDYVRKLLPSFSGSAPVTTGGTPAQPAAPGGAAPTVTVPATGAIDGRALMRLLAGQQQGVLAGRGVNPDFARQLAALVAGMRVSAPARAAGAAAAGSAASVTAGAVPSGSGGMPVPAQYRTAIIGTPRSGTHTLGNWQSDNALDIKVPVGTPIYAFADGTIGPQFGSLGSDGGRFNGYRLTVNAGGNAAWYGHLSRYAPGIKPGARVRKGQLIGYSGTANGVPHLHIGVQSGDPRRVLGLT